MLTKARVVAEAEGAGAGLVAFTRAWILAAGLDAAAIRQFKRLKSASEARTRGPEERADVKQAPGGIRDIETIVQFLSLLHCGKQPALVTPSTLLSLERLRVAGAISTLEASRLRAAYRFHRRVENLLQVMHRVQTHALPADHAPIARLMSSRLTGPRDAAAFDAELDEHRRHVRAAFERHFAGAFERLEGPAASVSELVLAGLPDDEAPARWSAGAADRPPAHRAAPRGRRVALPPPRRRNVGLRSWRRLRSARLMTRRGAHPSGAAARRRRAVLYEQLGEPRLLMLCISRPAPTSDLLAGSRILGRPGGRVAHRLAAAPARRAAGGPDRPGVDPWLLLSDLEAGTLRLGLPDLQDAAPIRQTLGDPRSCPRRAAARSTWCWRAPVASTASPPASRRLSARASAGLRCSRWARWAFRSTTPRRDLMFDSADGETERGLPSRSLRESRGGVLARVQGQRGGRGSIASTRGCGPKAPRVRWSPACAPSRPTTAARAPRCSSGRRCSRRASPRATPSWGSACCSSCAAWCAASRPTRAAARSPTSRAACARCALASRPRPARVTSSAAPAAWWTSSSSRSTWSCATAAGSPRCGARDAARAGAAGRRRRAAAGGRAVAEGHVSVLPAVETRPADALGLDTKEIPEDPEACRQLALRLGYADTAEGDAGHLLLVDLEQAASATRARYEALMR